MPRHYVIEDHEIPFMVKMLEKDGIEIKYNQDGTVSKAFLNRYIKRFQRWQREAAEMTPEKALKEMDGRMLTKEDLERAKERFRASEISEAEFKKVILYAYRHDPSLMFEKLFPHMSTNPRTGERTPSPAFHADVLQLYLNPKNTRIAIAAPRGHAKSTLTGFFYLLHQVLFGLKKSVVIISATEDLAIRFLRDVKNELEFSKHVRWLFGEQKTDKWSEKEIRLANGARILAKGRGAQLRGLREGGQRPDLIICDDLEDSEMVMSELRRVRLEEWFNGDVFPTLEPEVGQLIFIGTILHKDSLLNRVLNPNLYPDFVTRIYRAILDSGTPLWPERFSLENLLKIKESYLARGQLSTFYMEYMNDPVPSEGANFRDEYIQYFERLPYGAPLTAELFIDLGGGSLRATADPTAMVVVCTDRDTGDIYVEDYVNEVMGTDTDLILSHILRLATLHNVSRVYIEKTQATNMLRSALERKMKETRVHLNVEYIAPTRGSGDKRGKMSDGKYQRIAAMEAPFKLGVIKIRRWMVELKEQLLVFPRGQHDDLIDALAYGYMYGKKKYRKVGQQKQWVPKHRAGYLNR